MLLTHVNSYLMLLRDGPRAQDRFRPNTSQYQPLLPCKCLCSCAFFVALRVVMFEASIFTRETHPRDLLCNGSNNCKCYSTCQYFKCVNDATFGSWRFVSLLKEEKVNRRNPGGSGAVKRRFVPLFAPDFFSLS